MGRDFESVDALFGDHELFGVVGVLGRDLVAFFVGDVFVVLRIPLLDQIRHYILRLRIQK